ncbi:TVP38/TMEM64 family protein [Prochlorococcus sp. MIT 1223]|uniref:TVP38/TMEM64 family protein n=1 Tax=Prochlorococcus sp. MIT 1223 TaxID=3096217 RepID=UPI002A756546|nr:VTT domain-containing protein [Prochlorococcus sp. MIT 1223]
MNSFTSFLQDYLNFFDTSTGVFLFILFYALWITCLLPGLWPSMLAGALYGSFFGTIFVFMGAFIGAELTFYLSRKYFRDWSQRRIANFPRFQIIKKALSKEGLKLIILTRLSPVFPFSILNLFYGLSEVTFLDYSIGITAILPGTILYCGLGSLAGDIANFDTVLSNKDDTTSLFFSLLGVVATFAVIWIASKAAQKALQEFESPR